MRMSDNGVTRLADWEGKVTKNGMHFPYDDHTGKIVDEGDNVIGYLTIGYGHLLDRSELNSDLIEIGGKDIQYWKGLTEEQAQTLLDQDLDWAEDTVNKAVRVPLTQNQFEALVSFTFNVGGNAFRKSTLLKVLNRKDYEAVPAQFMRWTRSGGRVLQGLINRRKHEVEHWHGTDSEESGWRVW